MHRAASIRRDVGHASLSGRSRRPGGRRTTAAAAAVEYVQPSPVRPPAVHDVTTTAVVASQVSVPSASGSGVGNRVDRGLDALDAGGDSSQQATHAATASRGSAAGSDDRGDAPRARRRGRAARAGAAGRRARDRRRRFGDAACGPGRAARRGGCPRARRCRVRGSGCGRRTRRRARPRPRSAVAQRRQQHPLGAGLADVEVALLEAEVAGQPAAAGLAGARPRRARVLEQLAVGVPVVEERRAGGSAPGCHRAHAAAASGGSQPGVCSVSSSASVTVCSLDPRTSRSSGNRSGASERNTAVQRGSRPTHQPAGADVVGEDVDGAAQHLLRRVELAGRDPGQPAAHRFGGDVDRPARRPRAGRPRPGRCAGGSGW